MPIMGKLHHSEREVIDRYKELKSGVRTAKEFGISDAYVYVLLKKHGIKTGRGKNHNVIPHELIPLSDELNQVITGELLGDGYLSLAPRHKNAKFRHASKHSGYTEYLRKKFEAYSPVISNERGYSTLRTHNNPVFTELYEIWYDDKEKVVPHNLELTPTILLHWHLGDGSLLRKREDENMLYLHTQGFRKEDTEFLASLLEDLGIRVAIRFEKRNRKRGCGFYINVLTDSMIDYFDYIAENPIEPLQYRFQISNRYRKENQ